MSGILKWLSRTLERHQGSDTSQKAHFHNRVVKQLLFSAKEEQTVCVAV